jgi:hypothetical protein
MPDDEIVRVLARSVLLALLLPACGSPFEASDAIKENPRETGAHEAEPPGDAPGKPDADVPVDASSDDARPKKRRDAGTPPPEDAGSPAKDACIPMPTFVIQNAHTGAYMTVPTPVDCLCNYTCVCLQAADVCAGTASGEFYSCMGEPGYQEVSCL